MRKSYQGHIKDLPGKNIIKPDAVIREIIRVPDSEADTFVGPRNIRRLESEALEVFSVVPGVIPDVPPRPPKTTRFILHSTCVCVCVCVCVFVCVLGMLTTVRSKFTWPRRRPK